jgi:hypothetical protein
MERVVHGGFLRASCHGANCHRVRCHGVRCHGVNCTEGSRGRTIF